jgi:hypothetical protein
LPSAALAVRVTSALTQQGDQSLGSRMTRRRFAMPCSFSSRKTARRYGFQGLLNLHSLPHRFQGFAAMEINSSPGLEGIEKASGKDIASLMIEYIEKNLPIRK